MPRPPERQPLTRDRILEAAKRLLDRDGLDALSMRNLGSELGVEAMSLYNHFASKAALLDGVHEAILAEMRFRAFGADWTRSVRDMARAFRRVLAAHPNALPLFATRPAATPRSLLYVEASLDGLRHAGFSPDQALSAFQALVAFVVGHALWQFVPAGESTAPPFAALDAEQFPRIHEAAAIIAKHDLDREFEFGLDALVRGLEAKLSGR
jgi:TetR/AcrR family transcriptional regulator, tetracycline repressor protein